ncbi:MAG: helix-turn-helix domain-containing protein, partial [Candidatus Omnitrophota bacterium]
MTKNMNRTPFSARLRDARKAAGFTQKEMADKLMLDEVTYNRYESGDRLPKVDVLQNFYSLTGVNLIWLIIGEGDMYKKADIRDIYPDLPEDKRIDELIKHLQVPIIYHEVVSDFIIYKKKYADFINKYFTAKEVT